MLTIPELKAMRPPWGLRPHCCPHCDEALNVHAVPLVVATRNCPGCGHRVVAEPEPTSSPPPFTGEQLDAARDAERRLGSRVAWMLCVAFLMLFAVATGATLYRVTIREAVEPVADSGWLILAAIFAPLVVAAVAVVILVRRMERATPRCPHCGASLWHWPATRLTGNCWGCGRRMLTEEPAGSPAGTLPTVAEFNNSCARLAQADNRAGWIFFGLMVAVVASFFGLLAAVPDLPRFWDAIEKRYGLMIATVVQVGLAVVSSVVWIGLFAAGFYVIGRRRQKLREADPLLTCPRCRAALSPSRVVIASRRCPECRNRVLADPPADPGPTAVGVAEGPSAG